MMAEDGSAPERDGSDEDLHIDGHDAEGSGSEGVDPQVLAEAEMMAEDGSVPGEDGSDEHLYIDGHDNSSIAGAWAETLRAFACRDRLARQLEDAQSAAAKISEEAADCGEILEFLAAELAKDTSGRGEQGEGIQAIGKLKRELNVAKKRFEKEEKLAAERGADIEDLRERLASMERAASCYERETSAAEHRENSMREELAAKTREIETMTAALATQAQGQGREHDEAEDVDCAPAKADHAADIDRIYSAVFGGREAVGVVGGDVEISVVSVALEGSNRASVDDGEAGKSSVASRADEICEKTLELRDQLKRQQDEATALHEEVARLRESLAKAESDAVDAKGQARRLQEQIKQLRAAEADVETAAPAGMCNCLG